MHKNNLNKQDEKGSALILVLGILSLVMVLGMSFVFTARTERHVAQANSDQASAKMIAQSALNRIISDMKFEFWNNGDPIVYPAIENYNQTTAIFNFNTQNNQLYSYSTNPFVTTIPTGEQTYFDRKMNLGISSYNELPHLTQLPTSSSTQTFAYPITVKYKNAQGQDCTDVIGRYGYVILEEGSKIDVNSAMSFSEEIPFTLMNGNIYNASDNGNNIIKNYNRIASPYEAIVSSYNSDDDYVFNIAGTGTENITSGSNYEGENTIRLGLSLEEIQLDLDFWNKLPTGSSNVPKSPWMSYAHLANAINNFANDCFTYTFFGGEDIEAYWDSSSNIERSRFDLTGFTASSDTSGSYQVRQDANFWELTASENSSGRQSAGKAKIDLLKNNQRSEFWSTQLDSNGNNYACFDEKDERFYYNQNGTKQVIDTKSYGGIPWLALMKGDNNEDVSDQVAANLIDYSDSDDIATFDDGYDVTAGPTLADGNPPSYNTNDVNNPPTLAFFNTAPTYCGNEKVPYINEIVLSIDDGRTQNQNNNDEYEYSLEANATVELVNIYAGSVPQSSTNLNLELRIIGTFVVRSIPYTQVTGANKVHDTSQMKEHIYVMGGSNGYLKLTGSVSQFNDIGYNTIQLKNKIFPHTGDSILAQNTNTDFPQIVKATYDEPTQTIKSTDYYFGYKIEQIVVILYSGSSLNNDSICDFSFFPNDSYYNLPISSASETTGTLIPDNNIVLTMQASDPRCNLIAKKSNGSWDKDYWEIENYDGSTRPTDTLGADNQYKESGNTIELLKKNVPISSSTQDWECDITFDGTNPKSFSTAFIRNAPMESLWELGAIHRGMPFQTINLKKYSDPDPVNGNKYDQGDAAILDYVKIGPLRFVKGRVNANSRNIVAIEMLLDNISKETYDHQVDNTTNDFDYDVSNINSGNLTNGHYPISINRGIAANLLFDTLDTTKTNNDRDAEALIGKTAGLLTTRLDTYTVYIVAESLRDIREIRGNVSAYSSIQNTLINPVEVVHYLRAGDDHDHAGAGHVTSYCSVMGEQRMIVQLIRDAWRNDIKVARIKYIEE